MTGPYCNCIAHSLDQVVRATSAQLMAATAANVLAVTEQVLADLVDELDVDVSFLRHNDHNIRATQLVAEWPPRDVPAPDPIGLVYFAEADPIYASVEHLKEPLVVRPEQANQVYQRRTESGTGVAAHSLACVPLLSGDITTGTLGFVKYGDRDWANHELNSLQTIATLFAQLQGRLVAEEKLHYLANHDDLTGLLNRRTLIAHLDDRLAGGQPGPVAVFFIDLDRLKAINDYLGHNAGDQFIKAFGQSLRQAVGAPAMIARVGGDEFVVVPAAAMDAGAVELLAERLKVRLQTRVEIDGEILARTASIGVATGAPGLDSTSSVLMRADHATLAAKGTGGAKTVVFTPEMSAKHRIRNEIELHLDGLVDNDSGALVLHYLPEIDMRTGEILATEALARWQHPTQGLLLPESFIGLTESMNLAGKLGRLVMRSACADLIRWRSHGLGHDVLLRMNVSPVQLVAEGFVDTVRTLLDELGLPASAICFEITENVVVHNIAATRDTLAGLTALGVQIAIDDFGTGYSGLALLKSLPVDTVKIDKGFVRELGSDAGDLAIVRAIMALADAFELEVVAEGVETQRAAWTLLDVGCYRAQGFLWSRPIDGAAMESMLAKRFVPVKHASRLETLS